MLPSKKAKIHNVEEAISLSREIGKENGYENAMSEMTEKATTSIDGDTYYRLQQNYKGIPVYGKNIVLVTDSTGHTISIAENLDDVSATIDITPTVSTDTVQQNVISLLINRDGYSENAQISECLLSEENLCIFKKQGIERLAYNIPIVVGDNEYFNCYDAVVDAQTGAVLECSSLVYTDDEKSDFQRANKTLTIDYRTSVQGGETVSTLIDDNRHIRIYNSNKGTMKYEIKDYDGRVLIDLDGNKHQIDTSFDTLYVDLYSSKGISIPESKSRPPQFDKEAVTLMHNLQSTYDFYKEALGLDGIGLESRPTWVNGVYNDLRLKELSLEGWLEWDPENASSWGLAKYPLQDTVLSFGYENNLALDTVAHEYTHSLEARRSGMVYQGESGALMEALSDIFGELVESWETKGNPNWLHNTNRSLISPESKKDPSYYHGKYWKDSSNVSQLNDYGGVHKNSTVISHAAYLMWNGIDGNDSKKIPQNDLAKIWYRAMLMMPSDCNFIECRKLVEQAVKSMDLRAEQIQCMHCLFH